MADFKRLNRYRAELNKMKDKRADIDNKIREIERKCKEEESITIREIVREANMTPEQLATYIGMNGAEKLRKINATSSTETNEEREDRTKDEENL